MNWEAIGAIGEVLGAIAVVLTLIYLARQVSDAKLAVKRQTTQDVTNSFNELHRIIGASSEVSAIVAKVESGQELTQAEFVQYRSLQIASLNSFENMYLQVKSDEDEQALQEVTEMVKVFVQAPYIAEVWELHRHYTGKEFGELVSKYISEADT